MLDDPKCIGGDIVRGGERTRPAGSWQSVDGFTAELGDEASRDGGHLRDRSGEVQSILPGAQHSKLKWYESALGASPASVYVVQRTNAGNAYRDVAAEP